MTRAQSAGKAMLQGERDHHLMVFAAIDPSSRYCTAMISQLRFGALLAPFQSREAAEAALTEAGATIIVEVGK